MKSEICTNCDTTIGKLEQAYVFEDKIVCNTCYNELKSKDQADNNTVVRQSDPQAVVAMPMRDITQDDQSGSWFKKLVFVSLIIALIFAWTKIEHLEELRIEDAMEGGALLVVCGPH